MLIMTGQFYATLDSLDASSWTDNFFTEDAVMEFGNEPAMEGRETIKKVRVLNVNMNTDS